MPTPVSTTSLTAAESRLLDECRAHGACRAITDQIARMQARIAELQAQRVAADDDYKATLTSVLASKSPPIPVPDGAAVSRRTVNGVDSIVVTTP